MTLNETTENEGRGESCCGEAVDTFDDFPSLTLRATEILDGPDIGTMSGWRSHKIQRFDAG